MKIAVVGATGMVGQVMLRVLEERNFPVSELIPVASERSVGKEVMFKGKAVKVISMEDGVAAEPDIALFSAGGSVSKIWAPAFARKDCVVIDNSSAWRMDESKKLIVPEINAHLLTEEDKIIANPNCSTIQMVMVLAPLHEKYGLVRLVIATYQSVTGTGVKAKEQLMNEREGKNGDRAYPHPIDLNCLPHCDVFLENGYTKEEQKLVNETRKILGDDDIAVTATCVRVPVVGGHSEAVNITLEKEFELDEVRQLLADAKGVTILDNPEENVYPLPSLAHGKDEVFVGRIRRDESLENSLNLFIVADNLRKGAATNAVQIAEYLVAKNLIKPDSVLA